MSLTKPEHFYLQAVLSEKFGLPEFRPKQEEVINRILDKRHTLALLPTGYGKSICYQVPSQVLDGVTIVVSPLIALMHDQVQSLKRRGINNVAYLNSSNSQERNQIYGGLASGKYKLLYVAPERFRDGSFRRFLQQIKVSLFVIDEAHCISQWGHDFRPQYRNINSHLGLFPDAVVLALTATATPRVQVDIIHALGLPGMKTVCESFDRPNLFFTANELNSKEQKDEELLRAITSSGEPSLVYVTARKEAERLSELLIKNGISAAFYHADMPPVQKANVQNAFTLDQLQVIVCTVAFGMGIDKPNIRRVIHYSLPGSLENYYQEAGRAGRDGLPASCTLLFHNRDVNIQKFFLSKKYPEHWQILQIYNAIKDQGINGIDARSLSDLTSLEASALNSAIDLLKIIQYVDENEYGIFTERAGANANAIDLSHISARRKRDEERLEKMIDYARRNYCRRAQVLEYFGQLLETECTGCDICRPVIAGANRHIAPLPADLERNLNTRLLTIKNALLQTVFELKFPLGKSSVVLITRGSQSKKLKEKEADKLSTYGALKGFSEPEVSACMEELLKGSLLITKSGLYPTVSLSAAGRKMVEELQEAAVAGGRPIA